MIGSLRGTVVARSTRGEVVLEVGGVGYRVTVTPATMASAGAVGADAMLHTHLHVREDALTLFGFATADERDCFEMLIAAHGVGPALARAILSTHAPAELHQVVVDGDAASLTLVPGVGQKTAARLMIELRSRFEAMGPPDAAVADGSTNGANGDAGTARANARSEVRAALGALGYGEDEARQAVATVVPDLRPDVGVEDLLRAALRSLGARR